ncbi:MAG: endonuclease [Thermoleophilia bacterium]|nr:endonuclease [Thermoleophilia bacterium]
MDSDEPQPKSISGATRRAVIERDGRLCQVCGRPVVISSGRRSRKQHPDNLLTLDHLVPRSKGGSSTVDNLRVACRACNMRRSSRAIV